MVIDMGSHCLRKLPGAHLLVQIMVPGLEERARTELVMSCKLIQPGQQMKLPLFLLLLAKLGKVDGQAAVGKAPG